MEAAKVLQKAWRHHWRFARTPMLVKTLVHTLQLTTQHIQSIASFRELVLFLKGDALEKKLDSVLQRFVFAALARHAERPSFEIVPRIVLSAFLFAFRSDSVMHDPTRPINARLIELSKSMLQAFEAIATPMAQRNVAWGQLPLADTTRFYDQLEEYMHHFHMWRDSENERLKPNIMQNLEALQVLREAAPNVLILAVTYREIKRLRTTYKNAFGNEVGFFLFFLFLACPS